MKAVVQAFAPSRPLAIKPLPQSPPQCLRRHPLLPVRTTPRAARATLTPDSAPSPAIHQGCASPSASPQETELYHLAPADQARIAAVREQMEFWFSASNLRRDWYLRRQMDESGWLDPSTFLRFNRIKSLHATLHDIIVACNISDELEVSTPDDSFGDVEGQTRIRRSTALPDFREWDEDELPRSFLLKRIPQDSTVESLQVLLKPIASPSYIRIYRSKELPTSVAALICFEDLSTADSVFAAFAKDNRPEVKGIVMKRRNVTADGSEEVVAGVPSPAPKPSLLVFQVSDLPVPLEWKNLYDHLGKVFLERAGIPVRYLMFEQGTTTCYVTVADNPATRSMIKDFVDNGILIADLSCSVRLLQDREELRKYWLMASEYQAKRKARRFGKETSDRNSERQSRYPQGVILHIEGFSGETTWRGIKADLQEMGRLVYLSFDRKTSSCYARFGSPGEARAVAEALSGEDARQICGVDVSAYVLYGEEEEQYWQLAEKVRREKQRRQEEKDGTAGEIESSA